jgi:hypothetical protein
MTTVESVDSEESYEGGTTPTGVVGRTQRFPLPPAIGTPRTGIAPIGASSPGVMFDMNNADQAALFTMFQAMAAATANPYKPPAIYWIPQESAVSMKVEHGLVMASSILD